jgi:hypothetical protein
MAKKYKYLHFAPGPCPMCGRSERTLEQHKQCRERRRKTMNTCRTCQYWLVRDMWDRTEDSEGPLICRFAYAHQVDNGDGPVWPRTWSEDSCRGYRRAVAQMAALWIARIGLRIWDATWGKVRYWRLRRKWEREEWEWREKQKGGEG